MRVKRTLVTSILLICSLSFIIATAAAQDATTISSHTGHRFTEEYWAIDYDILSEELIHDYTPGEYVDDLESFTDRTPIMDANYHIAYIRTGQVQTLYMSMLNYSWSNNNDTYFGMAPYQMLQQHYRTGSGEHLVVQNVFAGLVAYKDVGNEPNVADAGDDLYYGYGLNSQYLKHLLDNRLAYHLGGYHPLNMSRFPSATPMTIERTLDDGTVQYEFGMIYQDLFMVWSDLKTANNFNGTLTAAQLLDSIVAFSYLDSLEFTYIITADLTEDRPVNITTTTEYDIGPLTDLWIIDDNESLATDMGGYYYDLHLLPTGHTVNRYNTSAAIDARLSGTEDEPGFSLALTNAARITAISASVENIPEFDTSDGTGDEIDPESDSQNVTAINIASDGLPAFGIDFTSKPNYTLEGGDPMHAPVKIYPRIHVKATEIRRVDDLTMHFINGINIEMARNRLEMLNQRLNMVGKEITVDIEHSTLFYAINFPEWKGKTINQDPTFVAYADPDLTESLRDRIPGYPLGFLVIGAVGCLSVILYRKFPLKNLQ